MGGLAAGSASAADLGGNCCADLEERIAELEATTARKGNRKVSLTISGWVAEQIMGWDDGSERNVYVGGLGTTLATNVKFTGQATISPGWYAGYVLHLEADGSDSLTQGQNTAQGPDLYGFLATNGSIISGVGGQNNFVHALQSFWFVKSDHLGKLSIGLQSQASDNTAILVDGSGSLVPANWVAFDVNGFGMRLKSGSLNYVGPLHGGLAMSTAVPSVGAWTPAVAWAGHGVTATACRRTPFATTARRSLASPCRPAGVRTTSGTWPLVTPASGTASSLLPPLPITKSPTATTTTSARLSVLLVPAISGSGFTGYVQQGRWWLHPVRVEGEVLPGWCLC